MLKKASSSSINKNLRAGSPLVTLEIILLTAILTNTTAYAQIQNPLGLKITSHEQGQEVPVGELTISGTSTDNATSDCIVYADVNDIKPFQKAIATGPGGLNDYSSWSFTISPQYAEIEEGLNKITAKATCDALYGPELKQDLLTKQFEKHYSINVTGIPSGNLAPPFSSPSEDIGVGEGGVGEGGESDGTDEDSLFG